METMARGVLEGAAPPLLGPDHTPRLAAHLRGLLFRVRCEALPLLRTHERFRQGLLGHDEGMHRQTELSRSRVRSARSAERRGPFQAP